MSDPRTIFTTVDALDCFIDAFLQPAVIPFPKKAATSTESYPIYEPVLIFQGDTRLEPILPHTVFWSHFVLERKRKLSMNMFHLIYVVSIENLLVQPLTWLNTSVIFFGTVPRNLDQSSLTFPNRCLLPRGSRNRSISAISESTGGCHEGHRDTILTGWT